MTITNLRKYLNDLPAEHDNDVVVVFGSDHTYYNAEAFVEDAEKSKRGGLYEYFDDANMNTGSKKVSVLLVR